MARTCAYCDQEAPLTREHVWPECFLEREGREAAHFSVKAQRVHGADYVVGDVCAPCNSTRLSPLDAYFCQLYDRYFFDLKDFGSQVVFEYDFDLLARALLKISYNSARSAGSALHAVAPMRKYVAGFEPRPSRLAVFVELLAPSLLPQADDPADLQKVLPQMYRSAVTQLTTPSGKRVETRFIEVRSFAFHLVLPLPDTTRRQFRSAALDLGRLIKGVVKLEPEHQEVEVRTSPQDGIRSFIPHVQAHAEQYEEYFERRRRANSEEEA